MPTLTLDSFGATFSVAAPEHVAERIVHAVNGFATACGDRPVDEAFAIAPAGDSRYRLERPGAEAMGVGTEAELVTRLVDTLHVLTSQRATRAMFIHAAAFALDGTLVIAPGRSGSGKSTLAAEAVRQGAAYYSDEFAPVDPDGLVHPYPRPLELRRDGYRQAATAADLGGSVAQSPARPDVVVWTRYEQGAVWNPELRTGASAALLLVDNTVLAREAPAASLRAAASVATLATTLVGPRGEAAETIELLRQRIATR